MCRGIHLPVHFHALSYGVHSAPVCNQNTSHTRSTHEDGMWLPKWQVNSEQLHISCNLSPEKQVCYLHEKRNAEEEEKEIA